VTDYIAAKAKLLEKQRELQNRLRSTEATEKQEVEQDLNESAQLWEVSEIRDALDDEAAMELKQISKAIERIDAGEFGNCELCAGPIGQERLEAMLSATLCMNCAEVY
jgi:DnaK suppressor protein